MYSGKSLCIFLTDLQPLAQHWLKGGRLMSTILIILLLIILLGGGGYYGHSRFGTAGLGGVLGTVLIVVIVLWLLGGLRIS